MAEVLTHVIVDGTTSGIVLPHNGKLVGVQAMATEKDCRIYTGTAATEANMLARVGVEQPAKVVMFPPNREPKFNTLYAAMDNAHGAIVWYIKT